MKKNYLEQQGTNPLIAINNDETLENVIAQVIHMTNAASVDPELKGMQFNLILVHQALNHLQASSGQQAA